MLHELTIFGEVDKVKKAIEVLQMYEPEEGYYVAFSGGKDSVTIKRLVEMAGVKHDTHYNLTTVDPPELVQFIKTLKDVQIERPEKTMWQLIEEMGMPPLRQMRYCCRILKEHGGDGRRVITGVRKQESVKRANRRMVEQCTLGNGKVYINPIIDWSESDVWEFIRTFNVPYCRLYDERWKRLGCVCCPNGDQKKQAKRWPKIADAYRRACIRAYNKAIAEGKPRTWASGEEMFNWWISGQHGKGQADQTVIFE